MTFYYSARATFGKNYDTFGLGWEGYASWQAKPQVSEIITLDDSLNTTLVENDGSRAYWDAVATDDFYKYGLFKSLPYVLGKTAAQGRFNLLAVVVEPTEDCNAFQLDDFEFVGYDLVDKEGDISSLTNCDGFFLSHSQEDLNQYGLLKDFAKAYDTKIKLLENNPDHHHADTLVMALWRHKTIGWENNVG